MADARLAGLYSICGCSVEARYIYTVAYAYCPTARINRTIFSRITLPLTMHATENGYVKYGATLVFKSFRVIYVPGNGFKWLRALLLFFLLLLLLLTFLVVVRTWLWRFVVAVVRASDSDLSSRDCEFSSRLVHCRVV